MDKHNMTHCRAVGLFLALSLAVIAGCFSCLRFPGDWPIPELTLPPNSRFSASRRIGTGDRNWAVWFSNSGSLQDMVRHVDESLVDLEYLRITPDPTYPDIAREWISKDGRTIVSIGTSSGESQYCISIQQYDMAKDYVLKNETEPIPTYDD